MIHYTDERVTLHHGDCLDVLRELPDASVDAVVTDPPYSISFMGRGWDAHATPGEFQHWCEQWATECLRVLKPGGHLLAFGGSRTWHRLAAGIEDAGFEMRDSIAWLYGSGFSKGGLLGNKPGIEWCACGENPLPYNHADNPDLLSVRGDLYAPVVARGASEDAGLFATVQREAARSGSGEARTQGPSGVVAGDSGSMARTDDRPLEPVMAGRLLPRAGQGLPDDTEAGAPTSAGERLRGGTPASHGAHDRAPSDAAGGSASHQRRQGGQPAGEPTAVPRPHDALDDRAHRDSPCCPRCGGLPSAFRGFSVTLKPAFEPIVVARKPLSGTVAQTVTAWGTGALNIDATRVQTDEALGRTNHTTSAFIDSANGSRAAHARTITIDNSAGKGRWPTNVVMTHSASCGTVDQPGPCVEGCPVWELDAQADGSSRFFPVSWWSCGDVSTRAASTSAGKMQGSSASSSHTDGSGSRPTDPSPTDMRSITATITPSTTTSTTSCASRPSGTTTTTSDSVNSTSGSTALNTADASGAPPTSPSTPSISGAPAPSMATARSAPSSTDASGSLPGETTSMHSAGPYGLPVETPDFPSFKYEAKAPTSERPRVTTQGGDLGVSLETAHPT